MKTENWENIKWIFEQDGALRDIYIQNTEISDWANVIYLLNSKYELTFGVDDKNLDDKIDVEYVKIMFADQTGELEVKSATIHLNGIIVKCHFFLEDQMEFDINPTQIYSETELKKITDFMTAISSRLSKQIKLCGENDPEFPLIKIDVNNGIEKILTEKEARSLWKEAKKNVNVISKIKSKIIMKYFPRILMKKVARGANRQYKSTSKEKNVW